MSEEKTEPSAEALEIACRYAMPGWPHVCARAIDAHTAKLREQVAEDRAVCICGCPPEAHESYGEDGESCENVECQCIRVCTAVAEIIKGLRAHIDAADTTIEDEEAAHQETLQLLDGVKAQLAQRDQALEAAESDIRAFRLQLFSAHPCAGRYGDDGEMQCNQRPPIDFKRDSVADIARKTVEHYYARLRKGE